MCGILAILDSAIVDEQTLKLLCALIDRRGPDYAPSTLDWRTKCGFSLKFKSSVLHLQGTVMQEQPVVDDQRNVFLYNGQVYKYDGRVIPEGKSDTTFLVEKLRNCETKSEVVNVFSLIDGPFAFVYWHDQLNCLIYGRDLFGRKSLCTLSNTESCQPGIISSVALATNRQLPANYHWSEVDCRLIYCIDYTDPHEPAYSYYEWNLDDIYPKSTKCLHGNLVSDKSIHQSIAIRYLLPLNDDSRNPSEFDDEVRSNAVDSFGQKLIQAISMRYRTNRPTCLSCRRVDRIHHNSGSEPCDHSKVAIAFSGGVDSTLIALALDSVIDVNDTIDLITVAFKECSPDRESVRIAFEELRRVKPQRNWRLILCDVSVEELKETRDKHIRHLISPCTTVIDDSLGCACWFIGRGKGRAIDSLQLSSNDADLDSILKFNTCELDVKDPHVMYDYISPASMLFVGSSIDEQLGGYSSHRSAWSTGGTRGLYDEILFQMRRLPTRNLGRDDRSYSDHGRDVKIPYLDFELVSFLNQLPIGLKMNLNESLDSGPKKILRELARKWGLELTSRRVKRAMQFGSRIANLESSKERGAEICSRLL